MGQRKLSKEEHTERHKFLHKALDELVADYIQHTENLPSKTMLAQFMDWSHKQTINPDENETD